MGNCAVRTQAHYSQYQHCICGGGTVNERIRRKLFEKFPSGEKDLKNKGLGSNTGEDMDVGKCIVPLRHGGTLNSRRAASPLVWLVEGEERWEAPDHPQGFLPLNWGGIEQNRTVTCIVLKAKTNDRRKNSCP
ncbi:uncharacterized protein TNCV_2188721 [Trichonephila clavipes]|nr:uncharacterized protein TNCV_2188721 [Trichonephila clavipes]